MMKKLPSVVLLVALCLNFVSCIKEDRTECPCYLVLDMSGIDGSVFGQVGLSVLSAGGFLHSDVLRDVYPSDYTVKVPRRGVVVTAFHGMGVAFNPEKGFAVPKGEAFPELWMYGSRVDTDADVARDTVRLCKSFCRLTIHLLSDGEPIPFSVGIDSHVCGYAPDGTILPGDFLVDLEPDSRGDCTVCVPRQSDDSMGLSLIDSGDVVRRFALGHYIEESGFDWSSPDLQDIELTVDFSRTTVSFIIRNWEITHEFYVEI